MSKVHKALQKSGKNTDMTTGDIKKLLVLFALPLLLGNIFQQLYNMVDTWVVGNFVGTEAFSAVGTVGPITNTMIGFFMGLANGGGVVIAQYFGAKKEKAVGEAVHTAMALALIMSVVLTFLGLFLVPVMLSWMNMPEEIWGQASVYLNIYFSGISALLIYNTGAAILNAVGDSKHPFYFLVTSTCVNIAGDLILVCGFHMGVEGVAIATVCSQIVSAVLVLRELCTSKTAVRMSFKRIRIVPHMLKRIIHIGIPGGLQMAIISFSNVFVQGYINQFGPDVMGGWTAYSKVDQIMFLPVQSIALAVTTFTGQNIGVGQIERTREGVNTGRKLAWLVSAALIVIIEAFAPYFVAFFNNNPAVIQSGTMLLRWITPCFLFNCSSQMHASALRGSGNAKAPMYILVFSYVIFRQCYLYIVSHYISNTLLPLAMGYPLGWFVCMVLVGAYYRHADLGKERITA